MTTLTENILLWILLWAQALADQATWDQAIWDQWMEETAMNTTEVTITNTTCQKAGTKWTETTSAEWLATSSTQPTTMVLTIWMRELATC